MAITYKRNEKGQILAKIGQGPSTVLVSKRFRMQGERRVDVIQFLNMDEGWARFAIRNLSMPMLYHTSAEDGHFQSYGRTGESRMTQYDGIVYLTIPDIKNTEAIHLTDAEGGVLAGSNLYGSSWVTSPKFKGVCLGATFNPLSLEPVDLLLFNRANRDLDWQGEPLHGAWISTNALPRPIFNITQWPTWNTTTPIPQEVLDATELWSDT